MTANRNPSIQLGGQLAEELIREANALQMEPQRLLASIIRPFVLALRQGRHEVSGAGRELGRQGISAATKGDP